MCGDGYDAQIDIFSGRQVFQRPVEVAIISPRSRYYRDLAPHQTEPIPPGAARFQRAVGLPLEPYASSVPSIFIHSRVHRWACIPAACGTPDPQEHLYRGLLTEPPTEPCS